MTIPDKKGTTSVYAFSKEYLTRMMEKIIEPIQKGESALVVWFPHTGKSIFLNEIFNIANIRTILNPTKYTFIRVDLSLVFHTNFVTGLLQYLYCEFADNQGNKTPKLAHYSDQELLRGIFEMSRKVVNTGAHIVLVVDEMESLTADQKTHVVHLISNLVFQNRNRVHSLLNVVNFDTLPLFEQSDKTYTLLQNRIEMAVPTAEDSIYFIKTLATNWRMRLTQKHIQMISAFFGNNLLVKTALRILCDNPHSTENELLMHKDIQHKLTIYRHLLGAQEKHILSKIQFGLDDFSLDEQIVVSYLDRLRIIKKKGRRWSISLPILNHLMKNTNKELEIHSDNQNSLFLGDYSLERILTPNEYKTIMLLFNKRGSLVERDELAHAIWGDVYLEKYSDWAIDKTISRIRKKLNALGFNKEMLRIIKGKGYKLIRSLP
jgi:DNA-binding winged helix-turn-helix (wHTH) protein